MAIWAFNRAGTGNMRKLVYQSVKSGKSRFGWSQKDQENLKLPDNKSENYSRQRFLLDIKQGDWIVHINTPQWGKCIAARVLSEYGFDEGLKNDKGNVDFRHYFEVDTSTIVEFERNSPAILPSVNLKPRYRYHKVYASDDFLKSIENLESDSVSSSDDHLKDKVKELMPALSDLIHQMNRGKNLEHFLKRVLEKIPGVVEVKENGSGYGTDHGADLILTVKTPLVELEQKVIVQVKSFGDVHHDLEAVEQVKEGIKWYKGDAGMIMTTAKKSEQLENEVSKASDELGVPIELLDAYDVAKLVIKHAPELVFNLE